MGKEIYDGEKRISEIMVRKTWYLGIKWDKSSRYSEGRGHNRERNSYSGGKRVEGRDEVGRGISFLSYGGNFREKERHYSWSGGMRRLEIRLMSL